MSLVERLKGGINEGKPPDCKLPGGRPDMSAYYKLKNKVHSRLVETLDLGSIPDLPKETLEDSIGEAVTEVAIKEGFPLNKNEQDALVSDVLNEIRGLGPIEPLIRDDTVQDILVNTFEHVYVEREGVLELTPIRFRDNEHLMQIIDKIVSSVGRRIDESSPMVDARLWDGSRVNAIIQPVALDGPILSIRRFGYRPLRIEDLVQRRSIPAEIVEYLQAAIRAKLNMLISGGTGSGKTTLLNILSAFIPSSERVVTIEDSAELQLQQAHVARLESRPPNVEGRGEITLRSLVRNSLRMRPDRIIVGEVRGAEALDMLQAMNTGHQGSMSTIHANTPRDALSRLEIMVRMGALQISEGALRSLMASAVNIVVHLERLSDGKRRLLSVSEVVGMEGEVIAMQEVFVFERRGVSSSGRIRGEFKATGAPSIYVEHMKQYGITIDPAVFKLQKPVGD